MKLPNQIENARRTILFAGLLSASTLLVDHVKAEPVEVNFSSPTQVGNGQPGTTAFFPNVATQDGVSVDMKATVLAATPGKVAKFSQINGNDFRFDAGYGSNTGTRFFRVRYRFFESGTNTPRAIDEMHWSIGDLDLTSSRTESVEVRGASAFLVDDPTNLDTAQNAQTMTITGTQDMDQDDPDGNPEATVSFVFRSRAVLEITYHVENGSGGYFDHVADGAFPFYKPTQMTFGVYYTFDISNDEEIPVKMDFEDTLPAGLQWDPDYEPVVAGVMAEIPAANGQDFALREHLEFAANNSRASFSGIPVPPGAGTFTLKTTGTNAHGRFNNRARVVQSSNSGFPQMEMFSDSVLDIPDPGPTPPEGPTGTLVESFKANFCSYTLFQIGGTANGSGGSGVGGDVAIAEGASNGFSGDQINGKVIKHNADPSQQSETQQDLSDEMTAAYALAEDFAAMPATQTFGTIKNSTTISATAADGMNVINVDTIKMSGTNVLTLSGKSKDWFIVNIASELSLSGSVRIVLNGLTPARILFNVGPGVGSADLTGGSGALGITILAPYSDVKLSGNSDIIGSVISGTGTQMSGTAKISGRASFGGQCF